MLENLIGTLKSEIGGQILSQTKLPSNNLDKVFSVIGDVAKKEVTGQMLGGGLSNVMNLFSNQPNNSGANLLQTNITTGVISGLASKLGLSADISKNIAQIAIPALINLITKKNSTTPDDDPSPLNEIFGGAGKGGLIGGVAKNLLGKFLKR
jgi:uncharacterized protein YidB (DUF937 family)